MRPIWKGSINFGLVNIPVTLYPATKREELRFHQLRASDLSPINYKRVAEADGKEVPWEKIVKGYEYEKGKYVVLKPEDFLRVDVEATQSVTIQSFVNIAEVDPLLFYKPYFMEPQKGADRAYVLLRDALVAAKKIGIAKVVIKTRQHLAALKPQDEGLMLELMRFPEEMVEVSEFRTPRESKLGKKELDMAKTLIASMTEKWKPEEYTDEYRDELKEVIKQKVKTGGKSLPPVKGRQKPTNVIDLLSVLQESVNSARGPKSKTKAKAPRRAAVRSARKAS